MGGSWGYLLLICLSINRLLIKKVSVASGGKAVFTPFKRTFLKFGVEKYFCSRRKSRSIKTISLSLSRVQAFTRRYFASVFQMSTGNKVRKSLENVCEDRMIFIPMTKLNFRPFLQQINDQSPKRTGKVSFRLYFLALSSFLPVC